MIFKDRIYYSGITFNIDDEFFCDDEKIVIMGFWVEKDEKIHVDLKRKLPIVTEILDIDEMFKIYGNLLKTKTNNKIFRG